MAEGQNKAMRISIGLLLMTGFVMILFGLITRYAGSWATRSDDADLGGRVLRSGTRGASATLTTSGRDVGLVAVAGPTQGRVSVYVDGRRAGTLDLRAAEPATRRVVWTRHFSRPGRHSVRLVVQGTAGRPWVSLDGWTVLA